MRAVEGRLLCWCVRVHDDIDEYTHVAVSRKRRLLVLDVPLPRCLDALKTKKLRFVSQ